MQLSPRLLGLATAAAIAAPAMRAEACTPARAGAHVASQPEAWRQVVATLLEASAREGQPWSCGGGVVDLVVHEGGGATLTVVSADGHAVSRDVLSPDEVEPLGEALLARPLPPPPEPPPLQPEEKPATAPAAPQDPPDLPSDSPPRVLVSAVAGPRYAGGSNLVWGGATGSAAIPFLGAWVAGAWLRYDGPAAAITEHADSATEACFGFSVGRTFSLKPIEIRTSVLGSAALVARDRHKKDDGHADDVQVDGRVGAEVRGVLPISRLFRAVVALDAELAPAELDDHHHGADTDTDSTPLPAYTVGLAVGVELSLR